jgi:catecholate siderophore receptor
VKFNEHFQADLGLRYDSVTDRLRDRGLRRVSWRTSAATTTPRPGVPVSSYKPVEKGSVYAAFSTSFAPVYDATHGLTLAATGATGQALGPERSRNFEVGTKWDLRTRFTSRRRFFNLEKNRCEGTTDLSGAR